MLLGVDLQDAREEVFVRMVCDGLSLGIAYVRAGFPATNHNAASRLFALPRIQERAAAILEARRTTGVVTLSEVTDMLKRVYAGAHASEEYNAAHNAAFSLARLYGHVTDRATVEVIRRPSRDPDAPSEQALTSWVESLPGLPSPAPAAPAFGVEAGSEGSEGSELPPPCAPAPLLGSGSTTVPAVPDIPHSSSLCAKSSENKAEKLNDFNEGRRGGTSCNAESAIASDAPQRAAGKAQGEIGNGAPSRPVTKIPTRGGHPAPLRKNGSPSENEGTTYPSAEELF